ncbi:hypothetical protein L2E82_26379 [Cichorium intybus]|uniref:Uncharacterized protein n=1 Tax=Cichorium intybus TaxID=13427 RepID=A0ACB9CQK7_CICIN|nr:hypothetical protein L2E82_26379 [Cichorium intybus]
MFHAITFNHVNSKPEAAHASTPPPPQSPKNPPKLSNSPRNSGDPSTAISSISIFLRHTNNNTINYTRNSF